MAELTDKVVGAVRKSIAPVVFGLASLVAPSQKAEGVIVHPGTFGETSQAVAHWLNIKNEYIGVSYSSLKLDAQLANMLWEAYGVADLYGNDFSALLSSGHFGFNISSGSEVRTGWSANIQSDGTILFNHVQGDPGVDYAVFSTGKTLTGSYFIGNDLLSAGNPEGKANYTFEIYETLSPFQKNHIGTIAGTLGMNNNGHFIEAFEGINTATYSHPELQYAFVPTLDHPITPIPEPGTYALIFGFVGLGAVGALKYLRKHGSKEGKKLVADMDALAEQANSQQYSPAQQSLNKIMEQRNYK